MKVLKALVLASVLPALAAPARASGLSRICDDSHYGSETREAACLVVRAASDFDKARSSVRAPLRSAVEALRAVDLILPPHKAQAWSDLETYWKRLREAERSFLAAGKSSESRSPFYAARQKWENEHIRLREDVRRGASASKDGAEALAEAAALAKSAAERLKKARGRLSSPKVEQREAIAAGIESLEGPLEAWRESVAGSVLGALDPARATLEEFLFVFDTEQISMESKLSSARLDDDPASRQAAVQRVEAKEAAHLRESEARMDDAVERALGVLQQLSPSWDPR